MSFILDALKKSETERQQQSNAEFAAVPSATSPGSIPRWLWVVGALLLINLIVLMSLLLRPDAPAVAPQSTVTAPPPAQTRAPSSFEQQVADARQRIPVPIPAAEEPVTISPSTSPTTRVEPVLISQNPDAVDTDDVHPTLQEVMANGSMSLPELHLDIHVFAPAVEDRFVFINMSKYREGMQLDEGPMVIEITANGVLLGHQGQSFLLPRE